MSNDSLDSMMQKDKDAKYLREAYRIAEKYSTYSKTHTGVVVVKDDKILVWGANYSASGS